MIGEDCLMAVPQEKTDKYICSTSAEICCFIGVFEHISDLASTLKAIK
jgi:hypothetical protein